MRFQGEYQFLSNFYPVTIVCWGIEYPTAEHAYVAAKTLDTDQRYAIAGLRTPGQAKRFGRELALRSDWKAIKEQVMLGILRRKFDYLHLRQMLIDTGSTEIIEHNNWHDQYWGVCLCPRCSGEGQNRLGHLLMKVRYECGGPCPPEKTD